jgi:hypothetical protein
MVGIGAIAIALFDLPAALTIVVIALIAWSIVLGLSAEGFL